MREAIEMWLEGFRSASTPRDTVVSPDIFSMMASFLPKIT